MFWNVQPSILPLAYIGWTSHHLWIRTIQRRNILFDYHHHRATISAVLRPVHHQPRPPPQTLTLPTPLPTLLIPSPLTSSLIPLSTPLIILIIAYINALNLQILS